MRSVNTVQIVALFIVLNISAETNAFRIFEVDGVETILAMENENVSLLCHAGTPITYCGFVHPNGSRYSFAGTSRSLINGHCAVMIRATPSDAGRWACHIGRNTGLELRRELRLRVAGRLAAVRELVPAVHGRAATLACMTTRARQPLQYCRFEPPAQAGSPFSIDAAVTAAQPLLGRYYFPANMSLDRGDCAVTLRRVRRADAGLWTCGAGLGAAGAGREHTATVRLQVEGLYTMTTASTTGVTLGVLAAIVALGALAALAWRRRRLLGARPREPVAIEVEELERVRARARSPSRSPRSPSRSLRSTSPMVAEPAPAPAPAVPALVVQSPSEPRSSP